MPNRRPKLEILGSTASPEEAAAVAAAIEQFLRDTAPPPAPAGPHRDPWQRAALLESVGMPVDFIGGDTAWGDPHPWG